MLPPTVTQKLESLEAKPGVYLFRASDGSLLYVGKASSLRSRVRSYFNESSSDGRYFVPLLQDSLADIETIVTATEKEAALLESELIKSHRPRYNVHLRDDKDFLSLRLDPRQAFPRLEVVRRPRADGARYFGPYPSATATPSCPLPPSTSSRSGASQPGWAARARANRRESTSSMAAKSSPRFALRT